jgi:nucleotide-binding universal stress UspA family protein
MFNKILVANDGSPGGRRAFEAGVELAKRLAVPLHMVMVEELPRFPASIEEIEEEKDEADHRFAPVMAWAQAQAQAAGIAIELHLVPGHAVEAIVALVREHRSACSWLVLWATRRSTNESSAAQPTDSSG